MKNRHLLIVMLALLMPLAMWGQEELTVNADGTFNNPSLPIAGEAINGDGGLFQSEFIIPSAELTAMNGKSVSVMTFYVASPSPNTWGDAQFNVFLKEVNYTTLDAFSGTDGATTVYSGSLDATGSAMDVFFDNTYPYTGGNLLVGFYLTTPGTNGMANFVGKMMEDNTAFIGLQNNPETYSGIPCLPKITFTYSNSAISCYKPRNLNAITGSTTAVLDWNNGNEETSWQLSYSTTSGNPEGGTLISITSHPHALSGLTNETTYYAYVRANCGDGYSDWSSVCSFTPSNSLSLTVNEGGMFDGGFQMPIYSYFTNEGVSSQFVIPAVELADVMNGQITKLTFYNMSSEISWGDAEFKIYLGEMEASEFSGTAIKPWTEMSEVYSGSLSVSNGMMEITLATSYNYGTDNLVVGFDQTTVGTQGSQYNDLWYGVSTNGSNIGLYSFGYSYTSASAVPKTTIQYTQGTPPTCVRPRNLHATVVSQEATLTWENGLDETSWEISYSTIEGSPSTGTIVSVNTQSYTITGLTNGTTYYAYVRANCGGSYSDWSAVCSFTPTDVVPTVDLTVYNGTYTGGGVPIQSQFTNYGVESQYIIPATNLAGAAYGQINSLTFYCNTASVSWGDAASFKVYLGETSLEHFSGTNILSWNDLTEVYSGSLFVSDNTLVISFTTPYEYEGDNLVIGVKQTVNGTPLTGISWYGVGDWDGNTALYGIFGSYSSNYYLPKTTLNYTPGTAPSCPKPKNLIASETEAHSTKLSWTNGGNESSWVLQYATDEDFTQNVVSELITTNPYVLSGLTSDITYYARIKAHCGEGDESDWSNICNFTPACPKPTNLCALNVGKASATMTWTNGGDESAWVLQCAADNEFSQNVVSMDVASNPCNITGLTPETTYYARIKADCGNGDESQWSNIYSFTPATDQIMVNGGLTTNNTVPVYGSWVDAFSKSQFIIPATTMGNEMTGANITKMTYYCSSATINWGVAEFDVYVKEVDNTAFSSTSLDWTDMTVVYSGQLSVSNNMMTIELSEPYQYGGGNLLIGIKQTKSGTYKGSFWYGVETDYNSAIGGYENSKELSYQQFLPKTTFTYVKAHCAEPTNLTINNITSNSAVFGWTAGSEVTNWQVQYKKTADAEWSESVVVNGTPSYTLSNLATATEYQARVRTNCGNDNFSDWVSTSFTTECDYISLPYTYGFENDEAGNIAPSCWHFHGSYYPRVDDDPYNYGNAHSGQNCLLIYQNSDNAANYVVFPEINTAETPINTLHVTFWGKRYGNEVYQYTYFDYLSLGVMTDPNDVSTFQYVSGATTDITNLEYKFFELYLDNYTGEGTYLAIRYNGSPLYYIDDIEISVAPTCRQPLDLSANYTSAHEADIRWKTRDLRQCNYQVSYSTNEGFDPNNGTIVDAEFTTSLVNAGTSYRDYELTCLNASTTYYFYVRANCGNGDFSEWSDDYASFTTQEACPAPGDFGAYIIKNTYAILQWHGDLEADWEFRYKKTSDEEWITPSNLELLIGEGDELRYRIDNLETNVEYIAQLRRHCGVYSCPSVDDGYSDWATYTFITSEGCQTPSAWMCLTQMGTSAKLEWNQVGEENYWQIRYRLSTENEYPAENIVLTDYMPEANKQQWTITGLQTNSMYYWQVRAYCDEENQSNWSNERYFFTGGEKITVNKANPFYEDFEGASGMPAGWMRCNQYNQELDYYYPWSFTLAEEPAWDEHPGNHAIYNNSDDFHGSTSVLTPEMHIDQNATSVMLSFNDYCDFSQSAISGQLMSYGSMQVMVSTNHGETYDYVWWSYGPKRYWHQHFVDLEEYIGMDIIIRFDYWWALTKPNFDWYVDDVRVQVFDKVGGGNANVTSGDWDNGDFWGGSVPDSDDDVIINANVTIPEGVVAEANQIVINTDTIQTGGRAQKFGKLTIADGGQLITNNAVEVTAQKTVSPWTTNPTGGWYFIASPLNEAYTPAGSMVSNEYDLYRLNNTTWENFKNTDEHDDFTALINGRGYLYASSDNTTLEFTGEIKTYDAENNTVAITEGWNLIGNPYTFDVYPNTSYYVMNSNRTALDPQTKSLNMAVAPCTGIIVKANANGTVAFSKEPLVGQTGGGGLHIALSQTNTRGAGQMDNAIVSFSEGDELPKFYFGESNANIYIPMDGEEYAVVSAKAQGELPLHFKAVEDGGYTLDFNSLDTEFSYLHLIDNLTGNDIDLLQTPYYSFDAHFSDYASRFKIIFVKDDAEMGDNFAFISDGKLVITGKGDLQVFDAVGRQIFAQQVSSTGVHLSPFTSSGVYVLRLIQGDHVRNQKIIIK